MSITAWENLLRKCSSEGVGRVGRHVVKLTFFRGELIPHEILASESDCGGCLHFDVHVQKEAENFKGHLSIVFLL